MNTISAVKLPKSYDQVYLQDITQEERNYIRELLRPDVEGHQEDVQFFRDKEQFCVNDLGGRSKWEGTIYGPWERFWQIEVEGAGFTPNTFKNLNHKRPRRLLSRLYAIKSVAVDIDYKKLGDFRHIRAEDFYDFLLLEGVIDKVPPPSYIEYGHQIRLIWLLREKVCVGRNKGLLEAINALVDRLTDVFREYGGEAQRLNSFYRFPGSVNEKTGDVVHVRQVSEERLTFQEMWDYLPDLPTWYAAWKDKRITTRTKKGKVTQIHNQATLIQERLAYFEALANDGHDTNRYNLVYLYAQHLAQIDALSWEKVQAFNTRLLHPLPEKELESKLRTLLQDRDAGARARHYKYKDKTIAELLGTEETMTSREREKQAKIMRGETRKQLAEANYQKAVLLHQQGMTQKEIAQEMGVTVRQVQRYYDRMRKEGQA